MGLFSSFEISASALTAERLRLDIIAENIANVNTTRAGVDEQGRAVPYRRRVPVFTPRGGPFASVLGGFLGNGGAILGEGGGFLGEGGGGVQVAEIRQVPETEAPFKLRYDPGHPDAGPDGYVRLPNVDVVREMVDMITATRAYEANLTALGAARSMFLRALELGR